MASLRSAEITIREERPSDAAAICAVHRALFPTPVEADLVDRLRQDDALVLSLVAEQAREIVGHVVFSRAKIVGEGESLPVAWLAPIAVLSQYQRQGIGAGLILTGIELCRARGLACSVVVGDPAYYERFGFTHEAASSLHSRFACEALMALLLDAAAGRLAGELIEPDAFAALA